MPHERVLAILEKDAGVAICPTAFAGLTSWLARRDFTGRVDGQLAALKHLQDELSECAKAVASEA